MVPSYFHGLEETWLHVQISTGIFAVMHAWKQDRALPHQRVWPLGAVGNNGLDVLPRIPRMYIAGPTI